jgi:glucose/arabinose dehydrogenase
MHSGSCPKLFALGLTAGACISFTDPAGAVQTQFTPVMDATLYEDAQGDVANGSGEHLYFGRVGPNAGELLRRALIKFDLTPIPQHADIESVSLTLEINKVPIGSVSGVAGLHRVTASWGEGASAVPAGEDGGAGVVAQAGDATWQDRFHPGTDWNSDGGDFEPAASAQQGYGFNPQSLVFPSTAALVADVTAWVRDPTTNHGWMVRGDEANAYSARRVYAKESAGEAVPLLTVQYSLPSPVDHLQLTEVATGLVRPVTIANAGDDSGRVFIIEAAGKIRILDTTTGTLLATPYLDINSLVLGGTTQFSEQGLLGLAFHPDFATNRKFYVYYTRDAGAALDRSVLAMYQQSVNDPDSANPVGTVLMEFEQDAANHNCGDLHFGADGYLYIASGDGGGSGDQYRNSQNVDSLKGKILRIDVDGSPPGGGELCGLGAAYGIPAGNAFPGSNDGCDEVLHLGLRNPWRFSFDGLTGDLYIGDVGQGLWEEVDFAAPGAAGLNFGWPCREGTHDYTPPPGVTCPLNPVEPIFDYSSATGGNLAITGGYVYRGSGSAMYGYYVYGDYGSDRIWLAGKENGSWASIEWVTAASVLTSLSAFGQDQHCELYVADVDAGKVFRIDDSEVLRRDGFEDRRCQ